MAINFSTLVYLPSFDTFARGVTFTPLASQPGVPSYTGRGIYSTRPIDVQALDGSFISDQQTILDVRDAEFSVVPQQLDRIYIGSDLDAGAALGDYEVVDTENNGGGETTLIIRKVVTAQAVMTAQNTAVFSYSIVIRDMLLAKLQTAPFFAGFTFRKSRQLPGQPEQLPFLGVYIISEEMVAEGDANHGDIDFIHDLKLGFSVAIVNNNPEACEEKLDQSFWAIMNTLWRDQYLMNLIDTRAYPGGVGNPDNTRIEGVLRGSRRHVFGTLQQNNETPIGEMRYEATVRYRAEYAPIITDDLLEIGLRTGVKPGETQEEMDQRQQISAEIVFETEPQKKE